MLSAVPLLTVALLSSSAFAQEARSIFGPLTSPLGPVVNVGCVKRFIPRIPCVFRLTTRICSYAAYAGNATLPDLTFYGGIPYIQPPVGNLRFAPPKQLDELPNLFLTNADVVDARNWGPLCIQQPAVVGIGSEGIFVFLCP